MVRYRTLLGNLQHMHSVGNNPRMWHIATTRHHSDPTAHDNFGAWDNPKWDWNHPTPDEQKIFEQVREGALSRHNPAQPATNNVAAPVDTDAIADAISAQVKALVGETVLPIATAVSNTTRMVNTNLTSMQAVVSDVEARMSKLEKQLPQTLEIKISNQPAKNVGVQHSAFGDLVTLVVTLEPTDRNIWIAGPAGSGKTTAAKTLADLLQIPYEFQGKADTGFKLSGFVDGYGKYHSTPFRRIYEGGGVILLDEVDGSSPGALLEINSATANGEASFPDQMINRHQDCYILCAGNTIGLGSDSQYTGRQKLDAAFLDRFVYLDWGYDENLESAVSLSREWTEVVQNTRKAAKDCGAQVLITPRMSIKGGQMLANGASRELVMNVTIGRFRRHSMWGTFGRYAIQFANKDN